MAPKAGQRKADSINHGTQYQFPEVQLDATYGG
jgi:hypothetical protein